MMFAKIFKFAAVGVVGVIALNLALRLIGIVFSILWSVVVFAAVGFLIYLFLRALGVGRIRPSDYDREERPESET